MATPPWLHDFLVEYSGKSLVQTPLGPLKCVLIREVPSFQEVNNTYRDAMESIYIWSWDLVKCPDWEVSFSRGSAGWGNNLHPPYMGSQAPVTAQRIVLTAVVTCRAHTRIVNQSGTVYKVVKLVTWPSA